MNLKAFYDYIRDDFKLNAKNILGFDFILKEAFEQQIPLWSLAYILATTWHETAHTMQPIEEYGKGKGRKYGKPDGPYGKVYFGRGYVQLTWLRNYELASKKLGVDFVKYPEKVMEPQYAVRILFEGMKDGWFTGKSLKDYVDNIDEVDKEDLREFTNARRVINGTDKQILIGQYAIKFEYALKEAGWPTEGSKKPVQEIFKTSGTQQPPETKPSVQPSNGFLRAILALLKAVFRMR